MPPYVGQYSYYDSRMAQKSKSHPIYLVTIQNYEDGLVACHYSLPYKKSEAFVTCLGIIKSVSKKSY